MNDATQPCPICGRLQRRVPRYPRYLCRECSAEAASPDGRALVFHNTHLSGGFGARYQDGQGVYEGHICFVRGTRCWADEARFGGIVIQTMLPGEDPS